VNAHARQRAGMPSFVSREPRSLVRALLRRSESPGYRAGRMASHVGAIRGGSRARPTASVLHGRTRLGAALDAWLGRAPDARTRLAGPQRQRHEPEYLIVFSVVALTAIGILMVYSSSAIRAYVNEQDTFAVVGPQLAWAVLGVVAMVIMLQLDYRYLRLLSIPMYAVALVLLLLVLIPGLGIQVGGSARWFQVGPLPAIHPAEFTKLALVVYLAHWFARRGTLASSLRQGTVPFLIVTAPVVLLVIREPDLGTAGVIALAAITVFFVAGARLWQFALLIPAGLAGVAAIILSHPYQLDRVRAFLDPWSDATGTGYHTVQGLLALGLGGLVGTGLGSSRQAGGLYLPNAWNDFIFAIIGEEFGLIGGLVVIALFVLLAYQGVRVALAAPDTFGGLLAAGITAWLTFQAFINIGVVIALVPITGITLPFISAGGSSLTISLAAVGVLLSISRETLPRGTWNDADPDRGGRDRRPRVPGTGRHPLPAHAPSRA
jgi:cell division protein FtsW